MLARKTTRIILCDGIRLLSGSLSIPMLEMSCESPHHLYNDPKELEKDSAR